MVLPELEQPAVLGSPPRVLSLIRSQVEAFTCIFKEAPGGLGGSRGTPEHSKKKEKNKPSLLFYDLPGGMKVALKEVFL